MATSRLTPKVLAFQEVPDYPINEVLEWALDMLTLGYETPNLLILASLSKSDNYFEKVSYFQKTCGDLGLVLKTGEAGIISYSSFFIQEIAHGNQVKANLEEVYRFCQIKDYEKSIYDFYLLYWAWDDFSYGEAYTAYWPDATPSTIKTLVMGAARQWISENGHALAIA